MRVLLILIGSAKFERHPAFSSPAFGISSRAVLKWFTGEGSGRMVGQDDVLSLFGSKLPWSEQEVLLTEWLADRQATTPAPTDVIIYYVGHGGFHQGTKNYYLAIRASRANNPYFTSLIMESFWLTLRDAARRIRRHVIIDSCFAASAVRTLQSPLNDVVGAKLRMLQETDAGEGMPSRGTTVLCSSAEDETSSSDGTGGCTQFTDCLLRALKAGSPGAGQRLSMAELRELIKDVVQERYIGEAVIPQIHEGKQRGRALQLAPIFPNVAWERRKAEPQAPTQLHAAAANQPTQVASPSPAPSAQFFAQLVERTDAIIATSSASDPLRVALLEVRGELIKVAKLMDVARAHVLFDSFDEYLLEAVKLGVDADRIMIISRHLISVMTLGNNALARNAVLAIIKAMEHFEMAGVGQAT